MSELDGVWRVERVSGLLPPLTGVRKRISGGGGETALGELPGVRFDVRGLELHYRAPLAGLVDVLERAEEGAYAGRAVLLGRELGRFRLLPLTTTTEEAGMSPELRARLVKHLDEAHAMEQNVLRMLDGMIKTTDDEDIVAQLEQHRRETEQHAARMAERLQAHGASPSVLKQAGGILGALAKLPLDVVRGEKAGRNARDGFATEHLEIASYELLRRVAQRAGDDETAQAATEIIAQEKAMADRISASWDRFAELSLEEGRP